MRFEALHYKMKQYAQAIKSRINLGKSIVLRHNFTIAHHALLHQSETVRSEPLKGDDLVSSFKWGVIVKDGNKYSLGDLITAGDEHELLQFGFISQICCEDEPFSF